MVDEASMIANLMGGNSAAVYLDDLIHFVYQGRNDRLLLIGDKAQLPPVASPADAPGMDCRFMSQIERGSPPESAVGYSLKCYPHP